MITWLLDSLFCYSVILLIFIITMKMIIDYKKDGAYLTGSDGSLAYLSLKESLKAYLGTYQSLRFYTKELSAVYACSGNSPVAEEITLSRDYVLSSTKSILHFHHFAELFLKTVLASKGFIYTLDHCKLSEDEFLKLTTINLSASEKTKYYQISFRDALQRVIKLIKNGSLDEEFHFIARYQEVLKRINELRNHYIHQGVFVLNVHKLDKTYSKVLQFILELVKVDSFKHLLQELEVGRGSLNILTKLSDRTKQKKISYKKISILKEIGRACFENPVKFDFLVDDLKKSAMTNASHHFNEYLCNKLVECPVCNVQSLVIHYDNNALEYDELQVCEDYIYKIKCYCCSFELDESILPPNYSINNIFEIKNLI